MMANNTNKKIDTAVDNCPHENINWIGIASKYSYANHTMASIH